MATLQQGSIGPQVSELQQALNEHGASPRLEVDGIFGPLTRIAVVAFQNTHGLDPDGIVGPLTRAALNLQDPDQQHPDIPADEATRISEVMGLLIQTHGYPVNAAAGMVGNLRAESGVMPNRVEGSASSTPMRARSFANVVTDFTAEQIMNRDRASMTGPLLPGIGLAQWTAAARRAGLFQHVFNGARLGAQILFNTAAQVDYLVHELTVSFASVNAVLQTPTVSVNDAADEVAYRFEVPGVVLDANGHLRPRSDPNVQQLFATRRALAQAALQTFESVHA